MMNAKKNWFKLTMAIVGVLFLIGVTGAQAASHLPVNGTETIYAFDHNGDEWKLDFEFDRNSKYDLTGTARVKSEKIYEANDNLIGTIYEFVIPNFYDPLPRKTVEIYMKGLNLAPGGRDLAEVLDVWGADSEYGTDAPAIFAEGLFVRGETTGDRRLYELWEIFPNPDFEHVKIWAPHNFELDSIQIVTQSVPLPPAALLLGSALFGLVFLRRKVR